MSTTAFDLTDKDAVPLNYFIALLPTIPLEEQLTITGKSTVTAIKRALVFAGISVKSTTTEGDITTYTAVRPDKNKLQSKPIEKEEKKAAAPASAPTTGQFSSWGIDPNKQSTTIDESELLKDTVTETKQFDCGTGEGPKKACKNCTCGLADQEVADAQAAQEKKEGSGGCGSCALGDAYRCAGCPSLGKPAWKTVNGKAIRLNTEDATVQ